MKKIKNKPVQCATCHRIRREMAMEIYDVPNDKYFCDEDCEANRKDRER